MVQPPRYRSGRRRGGGAEGEHLRRHALLGGGDGGDHHGRPVRGAGDPDRAAGALRWGLHLSLALCAGTVALVQLFAGPIVALFDPNPAVVAAGVTYLRICCSVNFAFYAAMYLFDSLATGVGAAGLAMGNAMLHSVVMRLALSWWLGGALGFSGLCWAEMLAPIPSALLGLLWFRLGRWRQRGPL